MKLHLVSPEKTTIHNIVWVELETPVGSFVIQPGHAPMILSLAQDQPINFRLTTGKQESIKVRQAVAEITRDKITVLINESS